MDWTETKARTYPRRYPVAGPSAPRERPAWMDLGACKGKNSNLFFPGSNDLGPAIAVCSDCPVRLDCLDYALRYEEFDGVWGGTGGEERRRIIKARRRSA